MLFFTLCVIFPLCMLPQMRKLELVGAFGSIILWVLAGIVMVKSCIEGLPALADGDFPKVSSNDLSELQLLGVSSDTPALMERATAAPGHLRLSDRTATRKACLRCQGTAPAAAAPAVQPACRKRSPCFVSPSTTRCELGS